MNKVDQLLLAFVYKYPEVSFSSGQPIFNNQDVPQHFLYLQSGCIKMSKISVSGNALTLHIFYPGSCISLLSLSAHPNSYDFTALTQVEAIQIPRADFIQFLQSDAEISYFFLQRMVQGLDGMLLRVSQMANATAYQRVASLLLYFISHVGSSGAAPTIQLSLTHQDIADWLGLSRENVSIQMKKLADAGFIGKQHHFIEVLQPDQLRSVLDER